MTENIDDIRRQTIEALKKVYSDSTIEHGLNPLNLGEIEGAEGITSFTGPCGDTMRIWLKINDNIIVNAGFLTDGCMATYACGSVATELVKGKNIAEAMTISREQILDSLGGLPEGNLHCALLAATAVKAAIADYRSTQKESWKRAYRKV